MVSIGRLKAFSLISLLFAFGVEACVGISVELPDSNKNRLCLYNFALVQLQPLEELRLYLNRSGDIKSGYHDPEMSRHVPPPITWTSKWNSLTFSFVSRKLPFAGLNERGISIVSLEIPSVYSSLGGVLDSDYLATDFDLMRFLLDQLSDIDELPELVSRVRFRPLIMDQQFLICSSKGCVTLRQGWDDWAIAKVEQLGVVSNTPHDTNPEPPLEFDLALPDATKRLVKEMAKKAFWPDSRWLLQFEWRGNKASVTYREVKERGLSRGLRFEVPNLLAKLSKSGCREAFLRLKGRSSTSNLIRETDANRGSMLRTNELSDIFSRAQQDYLLGR